MAKFTKYYVVEKTTDREKKVTDSIHFHHFDGVLEFDTKEAALEPLRKLYDLYFNKHYGKNHNWYENGFSFDGAFGAHFDYKVIEI
ncbi:MAG: hypothetical protein J5937_06290 [Paludibacteraceae bacterium]|nr:hypothetical protein [Paludibacteraceae bacterium]